MDGATYCFAGFRLDTAERQLLHDGAPVDLNSRYFDALALMVREGGSLISKDRLHEEVWRGVPVTDEAISQCIRVLRQRLGDDAGNPRFIETVPKHGYRFVADVDRDIPMDRASAVQPTLSNAMPLGLLAAIGGSVAGAIGGLVYGLAGASQGSGPGSGAASTLLVLVALGVALGLAGGAATGTGIALARRWQAGSAFAHMVGGGLGGMLVGAMARILGMDGFGLLLGRAPADMTGASEGLLLGALTGLALWGADRIGGARQRALALGLAALCGAAAGFVAAGLGGRLFAGSLASLAAVFPDATLNFDRIGAVFGEGGFGPLSLGVTTALEGALFTACVVGAYLWKQPGEITLASRK